MGNVNRDRARRSNEPVIARISIYTFGENNTTDKTHQYTTWLYPFGVGCSKAMRQKIKFVSPCLSGA